MQRFAIKLLLPQKRGQSLRQKLREINITSLEQRRTQSDLVECYKLLTSKYDVNTPKQLKKAETNTRGHNMKLFKPRAASTNTQNSFFHRVVDPWNNLPAHIINSDTTRQFKQHVNAHVNSTFIPKRAS